AATYRSNLFIIMLQNETSKAALRLVKERNKEDYAWSLSYRLYAAEPFPPRITLNEKVSRVEIAVDSLRLIKDHYQLTHEAMVNPFSPKAAALPPPPEPPQKKIPRPRYAPSLNPLRRRSGRPSGPPGAARPPPIAARPPDSSPHRARRCSTGCPRCT